MKKVVPFLLSGIILLGLAGCTQPDTPPGPDGGEEDTVISYEELYDGNAKEKYAEVTGQARYRASYGYTQNDTQGYNRWYYMSGNGTAFSSMTYENGSWQGGGAAIENGVLMPAGDTAAVFRFDPPSAGEVTVTGTFRMAEEGGGASLRVLCAGEQVYPAAGTLSVEGDDLTGIYFSFRMTLGSDPLDFVVTGQGKVYCNPTVDYTNTPNDSLYDTPDWGYYGDLHAYWHDDTVNMYHLRNVGPDQWEWYLDTTTDMFRYERARIYDTSFVKDHYMAYATAGDLVDYEIYPDGGRDCTLFYDEDAGIYRYIGLTYKQRTGVVNCDLSMRTSKTDDLYGDWNSAIPLRQFPGNSGEPECAAFRKIGDTWYLYCGISGQSVHGVGGLSYWKAEAGASIDQTDWVNATTYRLDGEDLCVPQIEEIGGRFYMWGWMPQTYNRNDWGGYKNLPREVYVREDGLLGTRLDEMATRLVNRGRLTDVTAENVSCTSGSVQAGNGSLSMTGTDNRAQLDLTADSTYVTFSLDMKDSTQAGFVMQANGSEYRAILVRRSDGVYLQIGCPQDGSHPVSSEVYLGDASMTQFDCKVVTDGVWRRGVRNGTNVEFYVNDTIVLSGRINLNMENGYTPVFWSDKAADFTGITVNRLAQRYDVYD